MNELHEAALRYADLEIPVLPLKARGKTPLINNGLKGATTDKAVIDGWWKRWPRANIGLVTGHRFDVVDLDGDEALESVESWCADRDVTPAEVFGDRPQAKTGRGRHFFIAATGSGNRVAVLPGVDVRGVGGYIVAPPSIHPNSAEYAWVVPLGPGPVPPPSDLLTELLTTREVRDGAAGGRTPMDAGRTTDYGRRALNDELAAMSVAREGDRNHTLHAAACNLLELINGGEIDPAALDELALTAQRTGLTAPEVDRTIESAGHTVGARARTAPEPRARAREDPPEGIHEMHETPGEVDSVDIVHAPPGTTRAHAREGSNDAAWEQPVPLVEPPVPFPTATLGELEPMAVGLAHAVQVPVDVTALGVLAATSTAVGGRRMVSIRAGWEELATLYALPVLASGERKSAALSVIRAPLAAAEAEFAKTKRAEVARERAKYEAQQALVDQKKREYSKGKGSLDELEAEADSLAGMDPPSIPRLLADDVTAEALGILMAEQKGRLGILSAEGGLVETLAGRYSNGVPNLDLILHSYTGESTKVDRVGRVAFVIDCPCLTLLLVVQPDVLRALSNTKEFRARGFLARYIYALPDSMVGKRQLDPAPLDPSTGEEYATGIEALVKNVWNDDEAQTVALHPGAYALLLEWLEGHEPRLADDGDLVDLRDWANRLPGMLIRSATLVKLYEEPGSSVVGRQDLERVLPLGPYLVSHARRAFNIINGRAATITPAQRLLDWLRSYGDDTVTVHRAHARIRGQSWVESVDDVRAAFRTLENYGWVRLIDDGRRDRPGRPESPTYQRHPELGTA